MTHTKFCELKDRILININGPDAVVFLHGLVTCDVENLNTGDITFGALLSPQGKILFDFFIIKSVDGFMLDIDKSMSDDFLHKLKFYKLRADIEVSQVSEKTKVFAVFGGEIEEIKTIEVDGICVPDPRLNKLGSRAYINRVPADFSVVEHSEYVALRNLHGMPSGGTDFIFGDTFPHEALMDQFGGVDFKKGCYIGQEVVSRMQHRGTARKRFISAISQANMPDIGTEIVVKGKTVGKIVSKSDKNAIALIRMDKAASTVLDDGSILAGSTAIKLHIQEWAKFNWPT
ncbi:MAG: folate-binding protein YgfZ [Rhizobiales bacterium]|nr:folate-binding protein YgfZ [Hyphomicrobiales bacterium]